MRLLEWLFGLIGLEKFEPKMERGYVLYQPSMEAYVANCEKPLSFTADVHEAMFVPDRNEGMCPSNCKKVRATRTTVIEVDE